MSAEKRKGVGCQKRYAFTLIELLVVVSIIALLISILLPALGRAREQAKTTVCLTNERQQGLVVQMYIGENDEFYPNSMHHSDVTDDVTDNISVWDRLESYGPEQPSQDVENPEGLWICPADKPAQKYPETYPRNDWRHTYYSERHQKHLYISYAYNTGATKWEYDAGYGMYCFTSPDVRKSNQVKNIYKSMVFQCGAYTRTITYWNASIDTACPVEPFHPGGYGGATNVLAADGHAETVIDLEPVKPYYDECLLDDGTYAEWVVPEIWFNVKW